MTIFGTHHKNLTLKFCVECTRPVSFIIQTKQKISQKNKVISLEYFKNSPVSNFQEINHAGAGGLWAELVSNRGYFQIYKSFFILRFQFTDSLEFSIILSILSIFLLFFLGFEAGGPDNTLNIYPWSVIGNESFISVSINHTSCFERNKAALLMKVYCGGHKPCPYGGVGISNPGYWGMVRKFIYTSHSNTHYNIFLLFVSCKFKSNK